VIFQISLGEIELGFVLINEDRRAAPPSTAKTSGELKPLELTASQVSNRLHPLDDFFVRGLDSFAHKALFIQLVKFLLTFDLAAAKTNSFLA
jgi:hypothetical protein